MEIIEGLIKQPYKILIYGEPGVGKTFLAAKAPKPVIIDLEGGANRYSVAKTPLIKTMDMFREAVKLTRKSDKESIIIDTADALDNLLVSEVLNEQGIKLLSDIGYGGGYKLVAEKWKKIIDDMNTYVERGKNLILLAHSNVRPFNNLITESYDIHKPKINDRALTDIMGKMDAVFFMQMRVFVTKEGVKTDEKRLIYTQGGGVFMAKNRFGLPKIIDNVDELFNLIEANNQ